MNSASLAGVSFSIVFNQRIALHNPRICADSDNLALELQGTSLYGGFTKLCKGLAVVLVGGHAAVQIFPAAVTYLALIPAKYA